MFYASAATSTTFVFIFRFWRYIFPSHSFAKLYFCWYMHRPDPILHIPSDSRILHLHLDFFFIKRDRERERESEICCKQWKLKISVLAWLNQENENALASSASQTVTNVVEKSTRKIDLAEKRIANQKPKIQRENHNKKYVVIAVYYYLNWRTRKKELSEHVCVCGFFCLSLKLTNLHDKSEKYVADRAERVRQGEWQAHLNYLHARK